MAAAEKLRVLYLAASPSGGAPEDEHNVDTDYDAIQEAIAAAGARARFRCLRVNGVRPRDLAQRLNTWQPHVVHFSGHGLRGRGLVFSDDLGDPLIAHAAGLRDLFAAAPNEHLSLVVLMTCYGRTLARALAPLVKVAAIGVEDRLEDADATAFNHAFYGALAAGRSVQQAYDQAVGLVRFADAPARNRPDLELGPRVDQDAVLVPPMAPERDGGGERLAQGLRLLALRQPEDAAGLFQQAVREDASDARAHFYLALAMLRGKTPSAIATLDRAEAIETHARAAAGQMPGAAAHLLWAWLRYDYFHRNGLAGRPPSHEDLLRVAHDLPDDCEGLQALVRQVPPTVPDDPVLRVIRARERRCARPGD